MSTVYLADIQLFSKSTMIMNFSQNVCHFAIVIFMVVLHLHGRAHSKTYIERAHSKEKIVTKWKHPMKAVASLKWITA